MANSEGRIEKEDCRLAVRKLAPTAGQSRDRYFGNPSGYDGED